MSLGYSRILYAAGAERNFSKVFGRVHPTGRFPTVSLLGINALAIPLLVFSGAVTLRVDDHSDRLPVYPSDLCPVRHPHISQGHLPPLGHVALPLPTIVALAGWIYVAATPDQRQYLGTAVILLLFGIGAFFLRARAVKSWPLGQAHGGSTSSG
ncbi:MAG: hypothetical protein AUG89_09995 [Acidobacteria bacterium 13_1_20CM_4_56_7]|nr:MAG: hypothetical protein AUG89_09995 [Acidobacteria bacterium 13_1_20CM_4_56_7]